jgi:predicted nucleic-acid-binding protein
MRAIDTNVLVRLIIRDDPTQTAAAEKFIAQGAWVSQLVLAESAWVLQTAYELDHHRLAAALELLLNHRDLTLQDADAIAPALAAYRRRPALGFSDCLIVEIARKAGHLPLGTFDRDLSKLSGAERI